MKLRHYVLLVGLFASLLGLLFVGRLQHVYMVLSLGGIALTAIGYLIILIVDASWSSKLRWTSILLLAMLVKYLSADVLIDTSYRYFLWSHEQDLDRINALVLSTTEDVHVFPKLGTNDVIPLSNIEAEELKERVHHTGAYLLWKTEHRIYYGLFGFLDTRLGLTYSTDPSDMADGFRHIKGNWYR